MRVWTRGRNQRRWEKGKEEKEKLRIRKKVLFYVFHEGDKKKIPKRTSSL
jgi:hypothetical protein